MEILEEMQPRRFFYAKHFVALRHLVSFKLEKLEQFAREGWIATADIEELAESLHDILHSLEHFSPRLAVHGLLHKHAHVTKERKSVMMRKVVAANKLKA